MANTLVTPKLTSYEDLLGIGEKDSEIIHVSYKKLHRSPYQYRDVGLTEEQIKEQVESLAFDIKADGKIQQPCIIRKNNSLRRGDYEIVVGHHRVLAAKYLTEEEKTEGFDLVPCIVQKLTDAQAEYLCNSSNNQRPKSDWHIMHELEAKMRLLKEHPEQFPHLKGPGRMIEKLAKEMNLSKSTVGEYLQISNNLSDNAMKYFETGEMSKSSAVAMASLDHKEQDKLIDAGVTKQKDIKAYKEEKIVHRTTVTDTIKKTYSKDIKDDAPANENEESRIVDVLPGQFRVANTDMELVEEEVYRSEMKAPADVINRIEEEIKAAAVEQMISIETVQLILNKYR